MYEFRSKGDYLLLESGSNPEWIIFPNKHQEDKVGNSYLDGIMLKAIYWVTTIKTLKNTVMSLFTKEYHILDLKAIQLSSILVRG